MATKLIAHRLKSKLQLRRDDTGAGLRHYHFSKASLLISTLVIAAIGGYILLSSLALTSNVGDANNDGQVNVTDLSMLLTNYGTSNVACDFNSDGTVNITDLSILLSHYGASVPSGSSLYGVPWQSDGLANLEIGKASGRLISIRFKAEKNEALSSARFYLIYRALGYYAGNGGQVKVDLRTDSGGFPTNTILATYTITNPMSLSANAAFPDVPLNASLIGGQTYHLVFTNPAPDSVNNWVSLDDLSGTTPQPADPDLVITWKYSSTDPWVVNTGHTPIVELSFTDGSNYGQQYIDVRSSSGLVNIGGGTTATETFTPAVNRNIGRVYAQTRKSGSPSALNYTLYENNTQVASASVSAASIGTSYDWVSAAMPYTLKSGFTYKLTLSASSGTYNIYPYQKGISYGFTDPFPGGQSSAGFDWPIYFGP